jgi:hypothetical protein
VHNILVVPGVAGDHGHAAAVLDAIAIGRLDDISVINCERGDAQSSA